MSGGTPYIGSTISLLSKAEIRYEGILWSIDTKDSTVTLANVRSYGTEDRAVEKQVAARSEVYEYIVFRGSDIKDLHVSKAPKPPETVNQDPSILQQGAIGSNFSQFPAPPYAPAYPAHPYGYGYQQSPYSPVPRPGINTGRPASPAGVALAHSRTPSPPINVGPIGSVPQAMTHESETQTPSQKATQTGKQGRKPSSRKNSLEMKQNGPNQPAVKQPEKQEEDESDGAKRVPEKSQRGGTNNQRRRGGNQQPGSRRSRPIKFNGDFDFESSDAVLDKEKIEEELKAELEQMKISQQDDEVIIENEADVESPNADVYYDKTKSFFDFITFDASSAPRGKRSSSWQEERKLNVQTFGVAGSYRGGWRGGWRGRWRGGRGRGRGRGRGGYYGGGNSDRSASGAGGYQQDKPSNRGGRGGYRGNRAGNNGNNTRPVNNGLSNVNRVNNERKD